MPRVRVLALAAVIAGGVAVCCAGDLLTAIRIEFGLHTSCSVEVAPAISDEPTVAERSRARDRITDGLLAGHLSLTEAAEELRRADGPLGHRILELVPGRTDDEKRRQLLIGLVERREVPGEHSVSRRLRAELDDWLAARSESGAENPCP
jgi:hypothetical protein